MKLSSASELLEKTQPWESPKDFVRMGILNRILTGVKGAEVKPAKDGQWVFTKENVARIGSFEEIAKECIKAAEHEWE